MSRLRVVPIVEGNGEVECVRILIERIWAMVGGEYVSVCRPILQSRGLLVKKEGLTRAIDLAREKLGDLPESSDPEMVLILLDADEDCAYEWGRKLLGWGREAHSDLDLACVLAVSEYETWFAASAESLKKSLDLPPDFVASDDSEKSRHGKRWVERYRRGASYQETIDQPKMTSVMDLDLCRRRSRSFNKLCREFEQRLGKEIA